LERRISTPLPEILKVPGASITTWLSGHASSAAEIAFVSSLPLGDSVAQTVVRFGMPPLYVTPGCQIVVRMDGSA
jgi:hypothetical protein